MTAVEWLEEELKANLKKVILEGDSELMESLFAQAKEMEKEQMETTWNNAIDAELKDKWQSFDQFHNETFKSE